MEIKHLTDKKVKELADILRSNRIVEFQFKNLHYQIFESCELGYCVNIYSSNEKDGAGDYLDKNLLDGGICTGSAKDAIEFLL